jgi:transposase
MRFDLSDEEWVQLEPLLPKSRKSVRVDDRKIVNAIFYVLRTGMPWRDLPARYGPYTTAYNRFNRGSRRGIWKLVFEKLASKSRDSLYLIDSTVVKAHRAASGGKGGEKSGNRRQPGRSDHENSRGCRQQRPAAQLHGDRWTSARQSSRRRDSDHAPIAARDHRRQGLRQRKSAPADQR